MQDRKRVASPFIKQLTKMMGLQGTLSGLLSRSDAMGLRILYPRNVLDVPYFMDATGSYFPTRNIVLIGSSTISDLVHQAA